MPDGRDLDRLPKEWPWEYIQAAGSARRMSVETRAIANGIAVQSVIGRDVGGRPQPTRNIVWDGNDLPVFANEVLASDEALTLVTAYYEEQPTPSRFVARPR